MGRRSASLAGGRARHSRPVAALCVGLASAFVGCAGAEPEEAKGGPARRAAAVASTAPVSAVGEAAGVGRSAAVDGGRGGDGTVPSAVRWFDGGLAASLELARGAGKLVLVDVGAYWCDGCQSLDETILVDPRVGELVGDRFVAVHVDAESGEGPEIVEQRRVQVYPTVLVLEPSGVEKGRIIAVSKVEAFVDDLERILAGGDTLAPLAAQLAADPDNLELAYQLASRHAQAAQRDEAELLYARVLAGDRDNARGLAARSLYDRALYFDFKLEGDAEAAIVGFRALQARFPGTPEAERAHREIGRAYASLGRHDEAIASLDAMLALRPDDPALHASYGWFSFRERCRPARGRAVVERGIVLAPDDAELFYLAAELSTLDGDAPTAVARITRAVELAPKSAFYRRQQRRFEELAAAAGAAGVG